MSPEEHGSVSVMETNPRTRPIGSSGFWLLASSVVCLSLSGCGHNPPRDNNGNLPHDVVRNFIGLVKADDYEGARKSWYGPSKVTTGPEDFQDFCARYKKIDFNKCKISRARKGKSGFSIVNIDWEEGGERKHDSFGLKIVDGEWKMERGYYW